MSERKPPPIVEVLRLEADWLERTLDPEQYQGVPETMREAARTILEYDWYTTP